MVGRGLLLGTLRRLSLFRMNEHRIGSGLHGITGHYNFLKSFMIGQMKHNIHKATLEYRSECARASSSCKSLVDNGVIRTLIEFQLDTLHCEQFSILLYQGVAGNSEH